MILHYAHLCAAAGGRRRLPDRLGDARADHDPRAARRPIRRCRPSAIWPPTSASILGAGTKLSYAADWSEYFGHQPGDGSGDVFFHLDPLWADAEIDFVGIDNYMPLSDWRDGCDHARRRRLRRRSTTATTCRRTSPAARASTGSTPATPTAPRRPGRRSPTARPASRGCSATRTCAPGGRTRTTTARAASRAARRRRGSRSRSRSGSPSSAAPRSIAARTSRTCSSTRSRRRASCRTSRAAGATTRSSGRYLEATYLWWGEPANNPVSPVYGGRMLRVAECAAWTWDARPYPFFPELDRRLDRRAELAARALADRPARRGLARRARARPLPPRRACPRTGSTSPASGARSRATSSPRSKARAPRSPRLRGTSASTRSRARA